MTLVRCDICECVVCVGPDDGDSGRAFQLHLHVLHAHAAQTSFSHAREPICYDPHEALE